MNTVEFLTHLRNLDIALQSKDGQLQVNGPREALTPDLRGQLSRRKAEILSFLRDAAQAAQSKPQIERVSRNGRIPLSSAQHRLWFLDQLDPQSSAYVMPIHARLRGRLDITVLEKSLAAIVHRHESLRTVFASTDGTPYQVIQNPTPGPFSVTDLGHLPPEERNRETERLATANARTPFDLGKGPLWRAQLLRLENEHYILLVAFHHIVFDGWSVGIFNRELSALYSAFCEGQPSPLPPLALQHADYALWQQDYLQGKTLEQLVDYWCGRLEGCPVLELPLDHPRPAFQTYTGAKASFVFPDALDRELRQLSKRENATIFMTLLAALKVLLFRYTGQEDIAVGIPIANRGRAGLENLIGCLLNTLVVRSRLPGTDSFRDVLRRVRNELLGAYAHQELPFEKLLEELQPERSLNRTPLFQIFVNFMHFDLVTPLFSGVEAQLLPPAEIEAKFDIEFYIADFEQRLRIDLVYNSDLFETATIERMLERFEVLLEAIVADPEKEIGAMALLTAEDRRKFTVQDNFVQPTNSFARFASGGLEQSIVSRFEEQALNFPDRLAVKSESFEWTYAELNRISTAIARAILRESGEASPSVALLLEHDAPMIAAIFGALKAGKAYVPLDPSHPKARLAYILEDAQAQVLLTDKANRRLANELSGHSIRVIEFPTSEQAESEASLGPYASSDDTAYLLYTSGSTGDPKGVTQIHRNVLHHIRNYTNSLHICFEDRLLLLASYGFDAAVMDIFGALLNGATLCPFNVRRHDLDELAKWMLEREITIYHSTPTLFRHFMGSLPERQIFPDLRLVVMGGERVLPQDIEICRRHTGSNCIFVNGFGPSESTVSLQYLLDGQSAVPANGVPIGYPVENTQVTLLSAEGHPGQVYGEIAIRSCYLALGYWRRPELTDAVFEMDRDEPGQRTYRTGDIGRLLPSGMIEFLGRRDFQVKIRGHRIELGEIETVLGRHPQVAGNVMVAREDEDGQPNLVAYIVPKGSGSSADWRAYLQSNLPDYMVPSAFVVLDKLPLTPNGKVDRRALPAPERRLEGYRPPRTPQEEMLCGIFAEVLKIERVGIDDNFFELGGHSLSATRLIARLKSAIQIDIPLQSIFTEPTVAGLSQHLLYDDLTGLYHYVGNIRRWNRLIPAQPKGSRTPLFLVAGYMDEDDTLRVLARIFPHLGPNQPVYGFQPRWLDGKSEGYSSVEEVVQEFLPDLKSVQPAGPYLLGGDCACGVIALEMARELLRQGEEVGLLVMLDTDRPTALVELLAQLRQGWRRGRHILEVIGQILRGGSRSRTLLVRDLVRRKLASVQEKTLEVSANDRIYRLRNEYRRMVYHHRVEKYPGRITLIVNEQQYQFWCGRLSWLVKQIGWSSRAQRGLEIIPTPGDHSTRYTDHSKELAERLLMCLDRAEVERAPRPERVREGMRMSRFAISAMRSSVIAAATMTLQESVVGALSMSEGLFF